MNRKKKLLINLITSLSYQVLSFACGFVLQRILLGHYGSAVNGLISSITQFFGFISLCECGVGYVVQSSLYKPLADKDDVEISRIFVSSERFFRKVAYILVAYTAGLMIVYPFITLDTFDYVYTLTLIFVISITTFAQYYFGMTYRLLLIADQLGFIYLGIHGIVLVLNLVGSIVLVKMDAPIQVVKLASSLVFLVQPILLGLIVKRRYRINRKVVMQGEPIKQKWNGMAQHVASVVLNNTDTVVLTLLSTLENVSIYAVYNLVVVGVKQIMVSLTNGIRATLGNMWARKELATLNRTFDFLEWVLHSVVTVVFSLTALLIVPFVQVYTKGVHDVDYIVPMFAALITLAQASYCLRLPYEIMVLAAGHYKETQLSAIIEVIINIVISVVLVSQFGLVGVALGTFAAMMYRSCYFALYLSRNIINRELKYFLKHLLVDALGVILVIICANGLKEILVMQTLSYVSWLVLAIKVGVMDITVIGLINVVFYKDYFVQILHRLKKKMRK